MTARKLDERRFDENEEISILAYLPQMYYKVCREPNKYGKTNPLRIERNVRPRNETSMIQQNIHLPQEIPTPNLKTPMSLWVSQD